MTLERKLTQLVDLSVKYLKEEISDEGAHELFSSLKEALEKENQLLLDRLRIEMENLGEEILEEWNEFIEIFCSSQMVLLDSGANELEAHLVLIPVILGVQAENHGQTDSFEIAQLGKIRELMVANNLILDHSENFGTLLPLLSFEDVAEMNETQKYKVLKLLLTANPKYKLSENEFSKPTEILPHRLEIKLKFIVGCVQLRSGDGASTLASLFDVQNDLGDSHLDKSANRIMDFCTHLSEALPSLLKKKKEIRFAVASATGVTEFNKQGLLIAAQTYDEFKQILLLEKSEELATPQIRVTQTDQGFLTISLFDGEEIIDQVNINSIYEDNEELMGFMNDFYDRLETHGFHLLPGNDELLIFAKKGKSSGLPKPSSSSQKMLH